MPDFDLVHDDDSECFTPCPFNGTNNCRALQRCTLRTGKSKNYEDFPNYLSRAISNVECETCHAFNSTTCAGIKEKGECKAYPEEEA